MLAQARGGLRGRNPSVPDDRDGQRVGGLDRRRRPFVGANRACWPPEREIKQLRAQLELATRQRQERAAGARAHGRSFTGAGAVSQAEHDNRTNAADAAAANVAAMSAALAGAEARYAQAQSRIVSDALAPRDELRTNAPRQLDVRRATVIAREAQPELAQAQLRQAELNLDYTKIVAPISGITGRKSMNVGDRVAPGQQLLAISRGRRALGHGQLPRDADSGHAPRPAGRACTSMPRGRDLRGTVESVGGRDGLAVQPLPARERGRQLRQGGPAHPGAHPLRARPAGARTSSSRHVGGARGPRPMTAAAVADAAAAAAPPSYRLTGWTGGRNPWIIALVVTLATFMEVLDTSIANVALPHIAGSLSASQDESTWVLTSYLVANAIVLPISGWFAIEAWAQAFLHDLRRAVHHQLASLRARALARRG